jgi:hypothetical protein
MNNIQKRFLLFLVGCIGTRTLLAIVAKMISVRYLPILGYIALIPAIGFIYLFLSGARKTGSETFGAKIWWNNLRPVHALVYILFAYAAISKNKDAWIILAIDVIIGLVSFLTHHYMEGNFAKLME